MKMYIKFHHDEIQKEIPYMIIAETTSRSVWNTGRRKRLMSQLFSESERRDISRIKTQAQNWAFVRGVPTEKGIHMSIGTYKLWHKLAEFCASL